MNNKPDIIPLFPLTGAILLPSQGLPLNIFEPRYLKMVRYALDSKRLIGMIQPKMADDGAPQDGTGALYSIGGAGRIGEHAETADGRIELVLDGAGRFTIEEELPMHDGGFRMARVRWWEEPQEEAEITVSEVGFKLKRFLDAAGVKLNWGEVEQLSGEELIDTFASMLPFPPEDKQAMLEAPSTAERYEVLSALAQMYANPDLLIGQKLH